MNEYHVPVLLQEAVDALSVKKGDRYIDCNFGGGGHSREILNLGGLVLGIDVDSNAIEQGRANFKEQLHQEQLWLHKGNFTTILDAASKTGWEEESVSGILYDLGLSTFQIKEENKGFSFDDDAPLDMRMDDELEVRAEDLIRGLSEKELADLIYRYGEEPQSRKFAKVIKGYLEEVGNSPVVTKDLSQEIKKSSKYKHSRIHPATRVLQALRIAINSELDNLKVSVGRAMQLLIPQGRLVVISFHSLEDAIAKELKASPALKTITSTPVIPSEEEIRNNPASRSAKMRIYEKRNTKDNKI